MKRKTKHPPLPNVSQLRVIGGKWRGRKLTFPAMPELRPTPDRVRETVFNWLAPVIHDAHCLDLFAGSGALGFEALSRGAAHAVMVDCSSLILQHLKTQIEQLEIDNATLIHADIPEATLSFDRPFDVVFLDPPFQKNLIAPCCEWLEKNGLLASNAIIYLETPSSLTSLPIPSHWELLRSKKAGQVGYHLAKVSPKKNKC